MTKDQYSEYRQNYRNLMRKKERQYKNGQKPWTSISKNNQSPRAGSFTGS